MHSIQRSFLYSETVFPLIFGTKCNCCYEVMVRIDKAVWQEALIFLFGKIKVGNTVLSSLIYFFFTGP